MTKANTNQILSLLSDEDRETLIKHYETKLEKLNSQVNEVALKLSELRGETVSGNESSGLQEPSEYKPEATRLQKIYHVLTLTDKPLPIREIGNKIAELEGAELDSKELNRLNVAIYQSLKNTDTTKLVKHQKANKTFIGLKK